MSGRTGVGRIPCTFREVLAGSWRDEGSRVPRAAQDGVGGGTVQATRGHVSRHKVAGTRAAGGSLCGQPRAEGEGWSSRPRRVVQEIACEGAASAACPSAAPAFRPALRPPPLYRCWAAAGIWARGRCRAPRWGHEAGGVSKARPRRPSPLRGGGAQGPQHLRTEGGSRSPSTQSSRGAPWPGSPGGRHRQGGDAPAPWGHSRPLPSPRVCGISLGLGEGIPRVRVLGEAECTDLRGGSCLGTDTEALPAQAPESRAHCVSACSLATTRLPRTLVPPPAGRAQAPGAPCPGSGPANPR